MKIAFDYQTFVLQSYGGISKYFTRLVQGLSYLGHEPIVFAPLHRNNNIVELSSNYLSGKYISKYPAKTTRLFFAYNYIKAHNEIIKWSPDIVHETYYSRFRSGSKKTPTVITVYDMIHELYPSYFPFYDKTISIKKKAINRADHIICISESTKKDLLRFNSDMSESKISVIHLGFDNNINYESNKVVIGKPFLLYVGQRGGYKNFNRFLKAVSLSKRICTDFDIVAYGGGAFNQQEMQLINRLGFKSNQVKQVSGDDAKLSAYYKAASAFVYPSLYEGFGIPLLEAMSNKCPVICSNTSSLPEVAGNAASYFDPNSAESIVYELEALLFCKVKSDSLIKLGMERTSNFSWKLCADRTAKSFDTLTASKKS